MSSITGRDASYGFIAVGVALALGAIVFLLVDFQARINHIHHSITCTTQSLHIPRVSDWVQAGVGRVAAEASNKSAAPPTEGPSLCQLIMSTCVELESSAVML